MYDLNLVYDQWDGINPLPNCSLNGQNDFIFFDFIKGKNKYFNVKTVNIKDVHLDAPHFYPINSNGYYNHRFLFEKNLLSEEVIYSIKNKNLKVIIVYPHETHENVVNDIFLEYHKFFEKNNLDGNSFYFLNNDINIKDYKNDTEMNLNHFPYLLYKSSMELRKIKTNFDNKQIDKLFLCLNGIAKMHRVSILAYLKYYDILDNVDWSLINTKSYPNKTYTNLVGSDYDILKSNFDFFDNLDIKKSDQENKKELNQSETNRLGFDCDIQTYNKTLVNIVTESFFFEKSVHISEKTFKPFYFFQIPIFLASFNFVKSIKSKYNFDVFDDIIDHSYDNEEDPAKRFSKFVDEIRRLNNMQNELFDFYYKNKKRFEKNHSIVYDFFQNNEIEKVFHKIIKENTKLVKLI